MDQCVLKTLPKQKKLTKSSDIEFSDMFRKEIIIKKIYGHTHTHRHNPDTHRRESWLAQAQIPCVILPSIATQV